MTNNTQTSRKNPYCDGQPDRNVQLLGRKVYLSDKPPFSIRSLIKRALDSLAVIDQDIQSFSKTG